MNRYLLLVRRHLAARQLGFAFWGRTKTDLPATVRLNRRRISLMYPDDGGYLSDIINLWLDDEYGLGQLPFAPRSIVDIGANVGLFSLWAWHRFPAAHIDAYEPNPRVLEFTRQNLAPTGVNVYPQAVAAQPGTCSLIDNRESRMASVTATDTGDVEMVSFAQAVQAAGGKIDLLKMDCEGGEWDIFSAADCFASVGCIRMEFHLDQGRSGQDVHDAAKQIGFRVDHFHDHGGYGIVWMSNPQWKIG